MFRDLLRSSVFWMLVAGVTGIVIGSTITANGNELGLLLCIVGGGLLGLVAAKASR